MRRTTDKAGARWSRGVAAAVASLLALATPAWAQSAVKAPEAPEIDARPTQIRGLEVEEHLGAPLPLELTFTNAQGEVVSLDKYFKGDKPAVVAMVYYDCPIVCDVLMEKLNVAFADLDLSIGDDFNVLLFSFDPSEGTEIAKKTKDRYVSGYARATTADQESKVAAGWEFHTSDAASARLLANAVGFKYRRMENGEFSHPVATYVITPTGKVSRYIHGFDISARDLKLSLLYASEGKIEPSLGDRLMSFCYMYDPKAGSYSLQAFRVMQVAGVVTVVTLGTVIGLLFAGERARRRLVGVRRSGTPGTDALVKAGATTPVVVKVKVPETVPVTTTGLHA